MRRTFGRLVAHGAIRFYQLTFSAVLGRQCRYWPSCSAYADEAIQRHGLWAGTWIGAARVCRCHPWGASGVDLVPVGLPVPARWYLPWRYGVWRMGLWRDVPFDLEARDDERRPPA